MNWFSWLCFFIFFSVLFHFGFVFRLSFYFFVCSVVVFMMGLFCHALVLTRVLIFEVFPCLGD